MRVCYSHYSLFFYSLFLFASQIRLIILSASFHLTMKSLTLLRFAFAYNMSKIGIITNRQGNCVQEKSANLFKLGRL